MGRTSMAVAPKTREAEGCQRACGAIWRERGTRTYSIAGTCLGVLGGRLGVWGGILARPETATIGISILDMRLLPIEWPNSLGSRGSWGWVSGLGPGALLGRETFPIWKGTVGRLCVLNHGCEMRLHQPKTPDCPWRGGRTVA